MKAKMHITRLVVIASLLVGAAVYAGSYTYQNSGYNPLGSAGFHTTYATPSTTSVAESITIENSDLMVNAGGDCEANPQNHSGDNFEVGLTVNPGQNGSNSGNKSGLPSDTYDLYEGWGGFANEVYGNCSITLSW